MDYLQFSLFFAGLLIGYVLVHVRLMKFEAYLKEVVVLKKLNERLTDVAEAMERIKVERVEEGLGQLHEDAGEALEALRAVERRVAQPADRVIEVASAPAEATQSAAERICAAIEERLFRLGYGKLRILTDLTGVQIEDEVTVQVECEKRMMPCKGSVVTRNGTIADVDIHTVVKMFP